jgi:hypothetical protein
MQFGGYTAHHLSNKNNESNARRIAFSRFRKYQLVEDSIHRGRLVQSGGLGQVRTTSGLRGGQRVTEEAFELSVSKASRSAVVPSFVCFAQHASIPVDHARSILGDRIPAFED